MLKMMPPDYKIPILDWPSDTGGYNNIPVDHADSRFSEPLVRLAEIGVASESFYARTDGKNWPYNTRIEGSLPEVWLREQVAAKLLRVNARIKPYDGELFVWDGYRSIAAQQGLWDFFEAQIRRELSAPTATELRSRLLPYVSDPTRFKRDDPTTWPGHSSGAAVDLTLRSLTSGDLLEMGAAFDEMQPVSHSDALERALARGEISSIDSVLNNRRLLHWAMEAEGFVNYPLEYWHFDWGDQMYVHNLNLLGAQSPLAAWYGYVDPPNEQR